MAKTKSKDKDKKAFALCWLCKSGEGVTSRKTMWAIKACDVRLCPDHINRPYQFI